MTTTRTPGTAPGTAKDVPSHIFEAEYYAQLAEIERTHWWALGLRALATRLLDSTPFVSRQLRTLDAGCGTGLTLTWVRRYTDLEPIGLDYSRHALEHCAAGGHRRLVEATAVMLPSGDAQFDLVLSADVIQHLPRPGGDVASFAEVARVLRPGGWFLLRTNSRSGQPVASTADYHRYSCPEVRALLTSAGLEAEVVTYANCLPGLLTTLRRRLVGAGRDVGDPGLRIATRTSSPIVAAAMYRVMRVEAWWIGTLRWPVPFGHSIVALARKPTSRSALAAVGEIRARQVRVRQVRVP